MSGDDGGEMRYTEYRCTNCGHATPKNTPPCDRCGGYDLEAVEVRGGDFEGETTAPTTLTLAREEPLLAGGIVALVCVLAVAGLAWTGVFVLADPTGTYRFGGVAATPPDGDGTTTTGEFRATLDREHTVTGVHWIGTRLDVRLESDAGSDDALAAEIMAVARTYADYIAAGGEGARLRLTVATERGDARVVVAREAARAYAAGELSEAEYRRRVLGDG